MNLEHLAQLRAGLDRLRAEGRDGEAWRPFCARTWATQAGVTLKAELPEGSRDRNQLRADLDAISDHEAAAALILAWGGMNRRYGGLFFGRRDRWIDIVAGLRSGALSAAEAYDLFFQLRQRGDLPGMGPAYFTKLIFFLRPDALGTPGYIMDQWTACSINLLCEGEVVAVDRLHGGAYRVADGNDVDVYNRFNALIEQIADDWGEKGETIEMALFDSGRPRIGLWRQYVEEHRRARWS